jgi:hypothetical protein
MNAYRDPYNSRPDEMKDGDYSLWGVKLLIVRPGVYRLYRVRYGEQDFENDEPQGARVGENEKKIAEALWPAIAPYLKCDYS